MPTPRKKPVLDPDLTDLDVAIVQHTGRAPELNEPEGLQSAEDAQAEIMSSHVTREPEVSVGGAEITGAQLAREHKLHEATGGDLSEATVVISDGKGAPEDEREVGAR
jgi:hypothetical protein